MVGLYGDVSAAQAAGTSGTTTVTSPVASPAGGTTTTSPFVINITWDSSVASAPAAFKNAVISAVQYLESVITSKVTVNIDVGYGEIAGQSMEAGALGESSSYLVSVSYAALRSALVANNTDATTASVLASLPSTCPASGTICITTAEAKALGLMSATNSATDAYVGFGSGYPFTYSGSVATGTYDFNGVALHELTETMGRVMLTGDNLTGGADYTLLDLLHYSASGTRDFSASKAGYFSDNGGVTNGGAFNTVSGGDAADWASSMGNNSFDAFSNSGVTNSFTSGDLTEMNALGWQVVGSAPSVAPPTGVSNTPVTADAAIQGGTKLVASKAIMSFAETGGKSGDAFTYALSGTGASSFSLSSSGTLSTGSSGVAGSAAGTLYALDVTVKDTTASVTSAAFPLQVVVGSSTAAATVSIDKLAGFVAAAPAFIYPGSGAGVTLDATGVTAQADFFVGTGADTFIGGSGVNDYIFGAVTDSSADIIKNFVAARDLLDFTGLGTKLTYDGAISGTSLAKDSVGFQVSGGNTYVYVNTTASVETLTKPSLRAELLGVIGLSSTNIIHL
jgi:hypothetical protein